MGKDTTVQICPGYRSPMSLNTQMKAFKRAFETRAAASVLGAFQCAEMALRQTDILERAL
jgi:hypothetical protein